MRKALSLISLGVSVCLACNNVKPAPDNIIEQGMAAINLSAVTNSNQTQTFTEVKRASLLPQAVLD